MINQILTTNNIEIIDVFYIKFYDENKMYSIAIFIAENRSLDLCKLLG